MTNTAANTVRVSAAIIGRDGRVLVCRRRADQKHPGKWEFPGGKIQGGESPEDCLARELREELAIEATIGELILRHHHSYPGGPDVELWFFDVSEFDREPTNEIFDTILWCEPDRVGELDLLEADRPVLDHLLSRSQRR